MKDLIKVASIHSNDERLPDIENPNGSDSSLIDPWEFVNGNVEKIITFLHEAGRNNADLACTHESITGSGLFTGDLDHPGIFKSLVEEIPGPTSKKLGEVAKQYGMYIAANYYEKFDDKIYNTSVLIDRNGEITGKYRKVHLADGERWYATPGDEIPVFETDIGRIGFAICYDVIFPELSRIAAVKGADIIIHQTQGWGAGRRAGRAVGEGFMMTRAAENSVYWIVSKNIQPGDGGKSCIIDNYGIILAESADDNECVVFAEFKPNYDMFDKYDFDNFYAGVSSVRARQLLARRPSAYSELTNGNPTVLDRFNGMEFQTPEKVKEKIMWLREIDSGEKAKYHW
jgi:predicted amidohydrolase